MGNGGGKTSNPYDHRFIITVVGGLAVGKSCLLDRFTTGEFTWHHCAMSSQCNIKEVRLMNKRIFLVFHDTSSIDRFREINRMYFKRSQGVLMVLDVTDKRSLYDLSHRLSHIREENPTAAIVIAGNKTDLEDWDLSRSTIETYAKEQNLDYVETSAKTGENINEIFELLTKRILEAQKIVTDFANPNRLMILVDSAVNTSKDEKVKLKEKMKN